MMLKQLGLANELRILVVEDNPGDLFLLQEQLNEFPGRQLRLWHTQSVRQTRAWLQENQADIILLDLSLPDASGLETMKQVMPLAPGVPIVVFSGLADTEVALSTVQMGAQDYLVKGEFQEQLLHKVISYSLERKRQLELLEQSEFKYKHLFERNPEAMFVFEQGSHAMLAVNQAAVTRYGYDRETFLRMRYEDLCVPEDRLRFLANPELFSDGEAGIWKHVTREGRIIYADLCWHRISFENQAAALVLVQDVTARVLAEQEKNELIQELTHKNSHLEQFAYIVSHNIRHPVANLLGLCQLLAEEDAGEGAQKQMLGYVHASALRLDEVVQHLNQILEIQKGLMHRAYTVTSLDQVLTHILGTYAPQLEAVGGSFASELEVPVISTIHSYLYSILENLISNAIKYRSPQRPLALRVCSRLSGEHIEISVSDNGLGLPADSEYVFGMYKRFHSHVEGRGLGLFMCKNQAEALGGRIEVSSELDVGTSFRLYLPPDALVAAP